jgi:hypothetical protein
MFVAEVKLVLVAFCQFKTAPLFADKVNVEGCVL